MKRLLILIFLVTAGINYALAADSPKDKLKENYQNKDYMEAANYIKDALRESPKDADICVICGDVYNEIGKLDSAVIMYRKANDLEGKNTKITRKLAVALSNIGNYNEAVKVLEQATKDNKNDIYNYLTLGQVYLNADSISQATLVITRAREMNKNLPDAYLALGDLYYKQQVYELARKNYEEAISRDENLIEARANLATTYFRLGINELGDSALSNQYFKNALDEWDKLAKKDPKYAKAYYEQGRILYFSKFYAFAIVKFKQYTNLRNMDFLGGWYLADSYYQNLGFDSAVVYLSKFSKEAEYLLKNVRSSVDSLKTKYRISVDSLNNLAGLYLGRTYYQVQNYKECINILSKLKAGKVKLELRDIDLIASSSFKTGDTVNAIKMYKEVINIDTTRCQLMFSVGQLLRSMKNFNESNYFFMKHLQYCKDSSVSKSLFYLGYNYFNLSAQDTSTKRQKLDSAIVFLLKSEAVNNKDLFTKIYLADAYAATERKDSAKAKFEEIINTGSKDTSTTTKLIVAQAFQKYAGLYMQEKNYKDLQKLAVQWTEYDAQSPNGWLYLAISYQAQSDKENACKYYKKVTQLDPNNAKVKDIIKKLCQ